VSNLSAAIVLAAGFGKRMNSSTPKVLHPICGMPMLGHVLETVQELKPTQIIAVVGHGKERVIKYLVTRSLPCSTTAIIWFGFNSSTVSKT